VREHGAEDLLADVEEPDLPRPLGRLAVAFVDQRQHGHGAERALDEQCEGSEKTAFGLVFLLFGRDVVV